MRYIVVLKPRPRLDTGNRLGSPLIELDYHWYSCLNAQYSGLH